MSETTVTRDKPIAVPSDSVNDAAASSADSGSPHRPSGRATIGIFVLLILYTCNLTQEVLVPVVLAILFALLLSPLVKALEKLRLPRAVGAFLVIVVLVGGFVAAVYALAQPARDWVSSVPTTVHTLQERFRFLQGPLRQAREASEKIQTITDPHQSKKVEVVSSAAPGMMDNVLSSLPHVMGSIVVVIILTFFLLSAGDNFLRRMVEVAPGFREKKVVVGIARDIQLEISRYLLTIGIINVALGCVTAGALFFLGISNPLLWGAVVALLNFAPYVGPGLALIALGLAGLNQYHFLGHALAVPGVFLLLTFCEGQLITPAVIGRRLALNPAVVFVWLLLWGWMWGLVGILLAGPLLASFRIVCLHVPALRGISVVISDVRVEVEA